VRGAARLGLTGLVTTVALALVLLTPPHERRAPAASPSPSPPTGPADPAPVDPQPADPTPPPAPPRSVTVVMSGDLLWHDTVWQSAHAEAVARHERRRYDFDPMFAALRPVVEHADVAICHEEVPFAADDRHLSSYPVFAAPPAIAGWIASMGWDACTTDSNHSIDQGYDGLVRTADLLERAGVRHVGTFRTRAERRHPVIVTTREGVKVGIVGGTYSLNGLTLPPGRRWAVSMWDADNLIAQARAARRAGADIVLVQYHGGDEYSPLPNAAQIALVRRLTASPYVDLVFAEHAHVVQPITKVHGKWVVYGMGNMVAQSDTAHPRAYEGITVRFRFAERHGRFAVASAAYVATVWNHVSGGAPIRIQRVETALARGAADRARLLEARRMTAEAVAGLTRGRDTVPGLHRR
jgi:poly-gamma-glutamate capsule biosynthesis protein CapA/YwtB (metallophosphatase superfamily)